jgi:hypothetical protein
VPLISTSVFRRARRRPGTPQGRPNQAGRSNRQYVIYS